MKYSTVDIRPNYSGTEWTVTFKDLPYDRVKTDAQPHSAGFYHYPTRMGKRKAFDALKEKLMLEHRTRIKDLQRSLEQLEALEFTSEVAV